MKTLPSFEIRVAVIGYVSVGKTTVINALVGAEYGQVSMRRTTAVVNNFRISTPTQVSAEDCGKPDASVPWPMMVDNPSTPDETLKQSTHDNAAFRNSDKVVEKSFDIILKEPLHDMRADVKLVIVDIPGINEAGTSSKYRDYVNDKWYSFDVAVVVMDGRQGVNTEEQLELLKLVKENSESIKSIPVIILCNKVDDPEEEEQSALLAEARKEIEKLFAVSNRKKALGKLLKASSAGTNYDPSLLPAVIPVSAMHAFLYRCGGTMTFEEFCNMDRTFIETIGKDSYGRQWRKFDHEKKLRKAYEAVSDEEQRQDGVEASNFDSFVSTLRYCIGNHSRQGDLLRWQVDVGIKRLSKSDDCDLGSEIMLAFKKLNALGDDTRRLSESFWTAYDQLEEEAFSAFGKDISPVGFAKPMKQLKSYFDMLPIDGWGGEKEKVIKHAKNFTLRYAVEILNEVKEWKGSEKERSLILGSMLLFSHDWTFCMHLGELKLELESWYMAINASMVNVKGSCGICKKPTSAYFAGDADYCGVCKIYWTTTLPRHCLSCSHINFQHDGLQVQCDSCLSNFRERVHSIKCENGRLVPVNKVFYESEVVIDIPPSPTDPKHYGHVIWQCCRFLKAYEAENADT